MIGVNKYLNFVLKAIYCFIKYIHLSNGEKRDRRSSDARVAKRDYI